MSVTIVSKNHFFCVKQKVKNYCLSDEWCFKSVNSYGNYFLVSQFFLRFLNVRLHLTDYTIKSWGNIKETSKISIILCIKWLEDLLHQIYIYDYIYCTFGQQPFFYTCYIECYKQKNYFYSSFYYAVTFSFMTTKI